MRFILIYIFVMASFCVYAQPPSNVIDPTSSPYNAKCDGITDDAPAFQAAFNAIGTAGNAIFIPATTPNTGCLWKETVIYNATKGGPIFIYGLGPASMIKVSASSGGLQINGSCGLAYERVYLRSMTFEGSGTPAFGVFLNGLAVYGLDGIDAIAFANGIQGAGAQQGYIHGGLSWQNGTGIYLGDCTGSVGNVSSSNGVDISGGRSFADDIAAVDIEGGAGDVWINHVHITSSQYGIINNQQDSAGGYAANEVSNVHLEANSIYSIDDRSGRLRVNFNSIMNGVHVSSAGIMYMEQNLIELQVVISLGGYANISNSILNRGISNKGTLIKSNNVCAQGVC